MIKTRVKVFIEGTFNKEDVVMGDQDAMWASLMKGMEYFYNHSMASDKDLKIEYLIMSLDMIPHMRITTTGNVYRQSFEHMVKQQLHLTHDIIYLRDLLPPYTFLLIPRGDGPVL